MTRQCDVELAAELAVVREEQKRLDSKCGVLTGVAGAVMALLPSQLGRAPLWAQLMLVLAGTTLAASAGMLLAGVLRPRLGSGGFMRYAAMTPEQIAHLMRYGFCHVDGQRVELRPAEELRFLSDLVRCKQQRLRTAIDLLITGLGLVAVALLAAVIAP